LSKHFKDSKQRSARCKRTSTSWRGRNPCV